MPRLSSRKRALFAVPAGLWLGDGAVEKTRTSTGFRPQRPQRCASTSSATTALVKRQRLAGAALGRARPLAKHMGAGNGHPFLAFTLQFGTMVNRPLTIAAAIRYGGQHAGSAHLVGSIGFRAGRSVRRATAWRFADDPRNGQSHGNSQDIVSG